MAPNKLKQRQGKGNRTRTTKQSDPFQLAQSHKHKILHRKIVGIWEQIQQVLALML